jgi:hypothetical protein
VKGDRRAAILGRRTSLIAGAKAIAGPFAACVQARLRPDHHLEGLSRDELVALAVVLAEAADPAVLRAIAGSADDGRSVLDRRDVMLRTAHTQAQAYRRRHGTEPPARLAILEREYYRNYYKKRGKPQRAAHASAA